MLITQRSSRSRRRDEDVRQRGMVTVEWAMGLILAGAAACVCAFLVTMVVQVGRCADSASQIARQIGRGDQQNEARARQTMPHGATAVATVQDGWVKVTVSEDVRWGRLGPFHLHASASSPLEPGQAGG